VHFSRVALLDVILVLFFKLSLSLSRFLLLFTHFHCSNHLSRSDISIFLLKFSLSLRHHIFGLPDICTFLAREISFSTHLALLSSFPRTLNSVELLLVYCPLSLLSHQLEISLIILVFNPLFNHLGLATSYCLFLLNILHISLQSVNSVL